MTPSPSTTIVIFGATGDLMGKKIVPALARLWQEKLLPSETRIIGMARRPFTDDAFRATLHESLLQHHQSSISKNFLSLFQYHQGQFSEASAFKALRDHVAGQALYFFAVPPEQYGQIFTNMHNAGLTGRILLEKPIGRDRASAHALNTLAKRLFGENNIYRIDHYLAKELLQAIPHFRFSNNLLESAWNNQTVSSIEIRLHETLGVEGRGNFYDPIGALRDVGQNHMLAMLASVTMDTPPSLDAESLHRMRTSILSTLAPWTRASIKAQTFRAQYNGYRDIEHVAPQSHTETFFAIKTELLHPAWRGVPIILEAGKRCPERRKEIVVNFKHPSVCLLCKPGHHTMNKVVFSLEPSDRIAIHFWTKKPGFERELEERVFSFFVHEHAREGQYVEEYAKIFHDAINGDRTLFLGADEVETMWRWTDPILRAWEQRIVPLETYAPGSAEMLTASASLTHPNAHTAKASKNIGIIGLGKMGGNLARRLLERGWSVTGYNQSPEETHALSYEGLTPTESLDDLLAKLPSPRVLWLMIPAGQPVDDLLFGKNGLAVKLRKGDIVIDGGNSFYKDTIRRHKKLAARRITFLDVGTSGGPSGARNGACLMIGGHEREARQLEHLFQDIATIDGYQFFDGVGAGHFVKMIHNGIEYGMMQAIAEGFAILKKAPFHLDLRRVADVYNHGSVIESRLLAWLRDAFTTHHDSLSDISGSVDHTGEGAWTVETARQLKINAAIIKGALDFRIASKRSPSYTGKILSALRGQFGGHSTHTKRPSRPRAMKTRRTGRR